MAEVIKINSKTIMKGNASGAALVSPVNFSFYAGVDPATAEIVDPHSVLKGENVTGKVLVYETGKSSTANCWYMYTMGKRGNAPAAIVNTKLDSIQVMGAVCGEIPMFLVDPAAEPDPVKVIETGDLVEIDGETGVITVTKQ